MADLFAPRQTPALEPISLRPMRLPDSPAMPEATAPAEPSRFAYTQEDLDAAWARAKPVEPPKAAGLKDDRTVTERVGDVLSDTGNAALGMVKGASDLFDPESALSKGIGGVIKESQANQSKWRQGYRKQIEDEIKADEAAGGTGIVPMLKGYLFAPTTFAADLVGNFAPTIAAALVGGPVAAGALGAAAGAGGVRGGYYERIMQADDNRLRSESPEYAKLRERLSELSAKREIATDIDTRLGAMMAAGGAVEGLAKMTGIERLVSGKAAAGGVKGALRTAGVEAGTEALSGGTQALGENVAVQSRLPSEPTMQGVARGAVQEGLMGAVGGGAFGFRKPGGQQESEKPDLTDPATSQPAAAPLALPAPGPQASAAPAWTAPAGAPPDDGGGGFPLATTPVQPGYQGETLPAEQNTPYWQLPSTPPTLIPEQITNNGRPWMLRSRAESEALKVGGQVVPVDGGFIVLKEAPLGLPGPGPVSGGQDASPDAGGGAGPAGLPAPSRVGPVGATAPATPAQPAAPEPVADGGTPDVALNPPETTPKGGADEALNPTGNLGSAAPAPAGAVTAERPAPVGKPVEVYKGVMGQGMTENNARPAANRKRAERPELDWRVEPMEGNPDRFVVNGYRKPAKRTAETPKSDAPADNDNIPPGAVDAERRAGLKGVAWTRGRGLNKNRYQASIGEVSGNYKDTADEALADLKIFLGSKKEGEARAAELQQASKAAADKIRRGENPTDAEWKIIVGAAPGHQYARQPAISQFLVEHLGVPKHNIRKSIGKAAGTLTSDSGAEYPIVYFKRLAQVFGQKPDAPAVPRETPKPAAKPAGKSRADINAERRSKWVKEHPFRAFLGGAGGVAIQHQREITGETGAKGNRMVPFFGPYFRKAGLPLDMLAERALEAGWLTQNDIEDNRDNGGVRRLTEMIAADFRDMPVEKRSGMTDAEYEAMKAARYDEYQPSVEEELDYLAQELADEVDLDVEALFNDPGEGFTDEEINQFLPDVPAGDYADEVAAARSADEAAAGAAQGGGRAGGNSAGQGAESFLTAPTEAGLRQKADQAERAAAEKARKDAAPPVEDFTLTGSNRPADVAAAAGQMELAPAPVIEPPKADGKIENVGQELPPARRHQAPSLDADLTDDYIANHPLSKIWPAEEVDKIEDKHAAAVAYAARAEIPAKPQKSYKLRQWVAQVKMLRGLASHLMSGNIPREKFEEIRRKFTSLDQWYAKVRLLEAIDRAQWKRIGKVGEYPNAYTYENGEKIVKPFVTVEIDDRHQQFQGAKTIADALEKINEKLGVEAEAKRMQFEVRGAKGTFRINKKGDPERRALKTFGDAKEAFAFIKANYDELVAAWEAVKDSDNVGEKDVRSEINRPRTGADYRKGKDVSAEDFRQTFGFRGVEFGSWVAQGKDAKERQGIVNQAYDALFDLATIVGIPPKAISLNGTLGVAFGSRGGGWASAHYEATNQVINLTKTRGAGALAHEWFHALDNYFGRFRGVPEFKGDQVAFRDAAYVTHKPEARWVRKDRPKGWEKLSRARLEALAKANPSDPRFNLDNWMPDPAHPVGVRPEVEQRFEALVKVLDESPMTERARRIDKSKSDGYWSRTLERAARSFENYVIAKMAQNGYQNDFLANVRQVEDFQRARERYPYLLPEEVAPVAAAFDDLFGAIKTKETDQGIAVYEDAPAYGSTIDVDGVARPRMNSEGRPIHPTEAGIRAFWRWFGDSKVVDEQGRPMVAYHGTDANFEAFNKDKIKSRFPFSIGYHFTTRPGEASLYASDGLGERVRDGGNVVSAYIRLTNPLVVDTGYLSASMEADLNSGPMFDKIGKARRAGMPHDGIVIRRSRGDEWDGWNVIAFRPEQIKSALGNTGAFDPANPSIVAEPAPSDNRRKRKVDPNVQRQLDLFIDRGPDESQAGPAGEKAQRAAVDAVVDLHTAGDLLGLTLSRDYAARQRVNLLGHQVGSAEDLATLAQVYRDPRFETFRLIFTDAAGNVVSQIGLTSRLPGSATAIIGDDIDAYLNKVMAAAKLRGAMSFWMLHNHPSGIATASQADKFLTTAFASRARAKGMLEFKSHVIIDTNEYSTIDDEGIPEKFKKDFPQPEPLTADEFAGAQITSPQDAMALAKRMAVDADAITLIVTDYQLRVVRVTSIPASVADLSSEKIKAAVAKATLKSIGARVFAVGGDRAALLKFDGAVVDALHVEESRGVRRVTSLRERFSSFNQGDLLINANRRLRLSPDTTPEFEPLRAETMPAGRGSNAKVAEAATDYQASPGRRRLRDRLRAVVDYVDSKTDVLSSLPDHREYLKRRYLALGRIARVDEIAKGIRETFGDASQGEKKAIYDYLTTAGATAEAISAPLRQAAINTKENIRAVGDKLVAAGMLDEAAREKYKDAYLPRLYLKHLLSEGDYVALGTGKKPSSMGYLKARKDLPKELREVILGEITDPAFLSAMAIVTPMRDIALLDFMAQISTNEKWVAENSVLEFDKQQVTPFWLKAEAARLREQSRYMENRENAAKARAMAERMDDAAAPAMQAMQATDHTDYRQIPDTPRYGRLRGLWVRKEIHEDIVGVYDIMPAQPNIVQSVFGYGGIGTKATQWWKVGKVTLNPGSQVRNAISNMVMLQLSGVPLHLVLPRVVQAIREIQSNGPHWKVAQKYGVTEATFSAQELAEIKTDAIKIQMESMGTSAIKRMGLAAMLVAHPIVSGASKVYQFMEQVGKTAKIIDAMKRQGLSEGEAALEAQKWMFDYSLVPNAVRYARNAPIGSPFATWMYKSAPRLLEVAALHPQRFLPWVGLFAALPYLAAMAIGGDDDDWRKVKEILPEQLRKKGHVAAVPFRDENGRIQFADYGPFMPWTMWSDFALNMGRGEPGTAVSDLAGNIFGGGPIFSVLATAATGGVDPFTDRPVFQKGDPPMRQALSVLNYAWTLAMPPVITDQGFAGKAIRAANETTDKFGDERQSYTAAATSLLGLNMYGIDPKHMASKETERLFREMRDTENRLKSQMSDRSLSESKKVELVNEYRDEMMRRADKIKEYRAKGLPSEELQPVPKR